MAFKTFAPGVLTSSDVNTFLMKQAVITCTSATRPASPNEGMVIYETDTDALAIYTGAAWRYTGHYQTYTPTFASGYTLGNGTLTGAYAQMGEFVHGSVLFQFGSTTVFTGDDLQITPPVSINASGSDQSNIGHGYAIDASLAFSYPIVIDRTGSSFRVRPLSKAAVGIDFVTQSAAVDQAIPFTWATSDQLNFTFFYREA